MSSELIDLVRLRAAYEKVRDELLAERTPDGHWVGELSSSALSTATAISALVIARKHAAHGFSTPYSVPNTQYPVPSAPPTPIDPFNDLIHRGIAWLVKQQNPDGGFGDTDLSHSNIATTYLALAALHLSGVASDHDELLVRANQYVEAQGGLAGLRRRYGIDKTFVVPIMTNMALAGLVDWREIDPLPFELACVPQSWYRFVGMPVVSYAIPALVAIGQTRFFHAPPRNPISLLIRHLAVQPSLKVLRRMQPESGGYLEATPLTSFVVMSLAACSPLAPDSEHAAKVIQEGVRFLANSIRPDGSWPIDTNLATWTTTLSINALTGAGEDVPKLVGQSCLDWLLSCQHIKRHPFTGADPGGFGWSDLSGAVPDADDTPGALLALSNWSRANFFENPLIADALLWLVSLQNRDGGWPTFCRGWGSLPFDRSGTDLTAHAIRALRVHQPRCVSMTEARRQGLIGRALEMLPTRIDKGIDRALAFLARRQNPDGSWSPLWFGSQDHSEEDNPVYGTAKVLMAYWYLGLMDAPEAQRGVAWLVANQNEDGGWGSGVWSKVRCGRQAELATVYGAESLGEPVLSTQYSVLSTPTNSETEILNPKSQIRHPQSAIPNLKSSLEETALAVEALLAAIAPGSTPATSHQPLATSLSRGLSWLLDRVENNQHRQPAPIGFYFAKLWYYERLYPLIFTTAALGRACRLLVRPDTTSQLEPSVTRAP